MEIRDPCSLRKLDPASPLCYVRDELRFHFAPFMVGANKIEIEKTCYTKFHKGKRRFTKDKSTSLTKCDEQKDILDETNEVSADLGSSISNNY